MKQNYTLKSFDPVFETMDVLALSGGVFDTQRNAWSTAYADVMEKLREEFDLPKAHIDAIVGAYGEIVRHIRLGDADRRKFFSVMDSEGEYLAPVLWEMDALLRCVPPEQRQSALRCALLSEVGIVGAPPQTNDDVICALDGAHDIGDAAKWTVVDLLYHFDERVTALRQVIEDNLPAVRAQCAMLTPLCEAFARQTTQLIQGHAMDAFLARIGFVLDCENYIVVPSVFRCSMLWAAVPELYSPELCAYVKGRPATLHLGVFTQSVYQSEQNRKDHTDTLLRLLRALADKSRLNILRLLQDAPRNGRELAKETGLSAATISHHMNELVSAELVALEKKGASIEYMLRRKDAGRALDALRKALLGTEP